MASLAGNKIISFLLMSLGLKRRPPESRFWRHVRRSERAVGFIALLYLGLQLFPQTLFAYSTTANGITLYSRTPLPPEAALCVVRASELLKHSELAVDGRKERVFVCDSPWLFRLFNPMAGDAFGYSIPVTDNVFIAAANFPKDVVTSFAANSRQRSISGTMAHEITHGLIRKQLGLLSGSTTATWVAEGYCDYIAREGSFPEADGLRLFTSGQDDPSASYRYFIYRKMAAHLIDDRHCTFSQVAACAGEYAEIEAETRQALLLKQAK